MLSRTFYVFGLLALAATSFSPKAYAQGNLIVNGDFNTSASGWVTNTSSGSYTLKGNPGGGFWLGSATTNISTISQVITALVPGSTYVISGSFDVEGGTLVNIPSFGVSIDGTFLFQAAPANYSWQSFNSSFVAASTNATLSLAARINGTSIYYRIDNIIVQLAPSLSLHTVGADFAVSWPTNTVGFSLQSATSLNSADWTMVTNTPITAGTNFSFALTSTQQTRFFRLSR
jgi:hypothetical protein